jgi:hypothetical protein
MRFVSPHRSILNSAVSGTVDATYFNTWLTSSSPGHPAKTTGSMSLTATAGISIDTIAVVSHRISPGATITAGSLGTIPTTAARSNDIPLNHGRVVTPASPASIVFTVTGNTGPVYVGLFYAGLSYIFNDYLSGRRYTPEAPFPWEGEFSSLAPHDPGLSDQRRVSGTIIITDASFEELELTREAQRRGNRPVLWVESDTVNDPWLCQFSFEDAHTEGWHFVNLQIAEIPRLRWPA